MARIGVILNSYPKVSETFVHQEIAKMVQSGQDLELFSIFKPSGEQIAQVDWEDLLTVHYLLLQVTPIKLIAAHLNYIFKKFFSYFKLVNFAIKNRNERSIFRLLRSLTSAIKNSDQADKSTRQEIMLHFLITPVFARIVEKQQIDHLHAHFADAATSFAMLMGILLDIPYSITAHAYDVFTPQANIEQKLRRALFIVTCTKYNRKYWLEQFPWLDSDKIKVVYHGINWHRFRHDKNIRREEPTIISVGRLVPKKGIAYLLKACLILKEKKIPFRCTIVGDGPERPRLEMFCNINQLNGSVSFTGTIPQTKIKELLNKAAVFALPCVVEPSGNRDGIPNVIAEAMAMELPVVSTTISGIPELVVDEKHGYLLEPGDFQALAEKLQILLENTGLREQLGSAGRKRVQQIFDVDKCLEDLITVFDNAL